MRKGERNPCSGSRSGIDRRIEGNETPPGLVDEVEEEAEAGLDESIVLLDAAEHGDGVWHTDLANGMTDIHTPDERIAVDDLERMVDVTLALVDVALEHAP